MLMHRTLSAALLAVAVLALGSIAQPVAAAQSPGCEPPAAGAPVTITGTRQGDSAPFVLDGGAYTVDWSMTEPSTALSFINLEAASLLPAETEIQQHLRSAVILHASGGKDGADGRTHLYNVKAGTYYLHVRAPAGWSVTFTAVAV
ncbi:MAG: hypothetical protein ACJ77I_06980 [Chloroflexota bacterium]